MKKLIWIFLLLNAFSSSAQNLYNPSILGQPSRNIKVGNGFQVDDTLLVKGIVWFSGILTDNSLDTVYGVKNGVLYKRLVSTISSTERKVDTLYRTPGKDSIVFTVNNIRYAIKDSTGGGGGDASLSGLTAATATNNIFNTNYKQRWNWNTLAGDTAIVISSNSTAAASDLQNLLTIAQSGANSTSTQTTYAAQFSNTKTGAASTNIAGKFTASGASTNYALDLTGWVRMTAGDKMLFGNSSAIYNFTAGSALWVESPSAGELVLQASGSNGRVGVYKGNVTTIGLGYLTSTRQSIGFSADQSGTTHRSVGSTAGVIEHDNGKLYLCANTGLSGGYATFTANQVMVINGGASVATSNVGIGTSSPASSSVLDLTSTTKGFLPPRMTTTQRDAIASPATGLTLFCTDCTATDASTGVMQTYNGTSWKNFW